MTCTFCEAEAVSEFEPAQWPDRDLTIPFCAPHRALAVNAVGCYQVTDAVHERGTIGTYDLLVPADFEGHFEPSACPYHAKGDRSCNLYREED